ncbi:MAG: efflux RND transporter permease subunit [Calditrichia bacterium]
MSKPSFLPNLAVKRPVTIVVSLFAILVIGAIAYVRIPIELLPQGFTAPFLGVWVSYPNANPEEVEEQIARPVEEQVRTINGVDRVETYSQVNGCWTWLELDHDTDPDDAYDQLRDRMERVRATLPADVDRYFLRKFGQNDPPIIFLSVAYPDGVKDPFHLVENYLKRPIERIDGVANIEVYGTDEKSIQIKLNQDKIKAHRLNMFDVINEMQQDNFAMSSGWVYEGDKKFIVRSVARFDDLEAVRTLPINNLGLTIGDVADVDFDITKRTWTQTINGGPGVLIEIFKESLANTVDISRELSTILKEDIAKHPALSELDINLIFVQGEFIEEAVNNLRDTAMWGGFFAILILLLFLRNIRMTIIMMFAIPLSILIALVCVYFIGWTLNVITMMSIMISIGMVVDNGIVVLENIYRRRSEGESPQEASIFGASEVNLAIIMATLTTIMVFVPILLIEGSGFAFYMRRIGMPVIFALAGSLFVALVLIPLATSHFSTDGLAKESRFISYIKARYMIVLDKALRNRLNVVIFAFGIIMMTGVFIGLVPSSGDSDGGPNDVTLMFDLPGHYSKEDAQTFFNEVEDTVRANAHKYNIKSMNTGFRQTFGRTRLYLNSPPRAQWYDVLWEGMQTVAGIEVDKPMTQDEVLEDLKKRVPSKPGVKFRTSWFGASSSDAGSVSIMLYGDDTGKLEELAEEVERRMKLLDGVISVESGNETGSDEILINVDREVATRNGINANQIAYTLQYAVRGMTLSRVQASDREIDIRVQFREEDRENLMQLKNMSFISSNGQAVPLDALAEFQIQKGFGQIGRENGKTFISITAKSTSDNIEELRGQINGIMESFPLPYGYSWNPGNRFRSFDDDQQAFANALMLSVIFIYILMAILFESTFIPLSILLSIPLSFFGAFMMLAITGTSADIMANIGIVILVGVVVNNGIVLLDMVIRRRKEGFSRYEAIIEAGQHRFRPILMTSFTTIFGLLPMALGTGNLIGIPYAPMGRAIVGGMLTSTVLTLVIVPVFYSLFDDLSIHMYRMIAWLKGTGKQEVAPGAAALSSTEK